MYFLYSGPKSDLIFLACLVFHRVRILHMLKTVSRVGKGFADFMIHIKTLSESFLHGASPFLFCYSIKFGPDSVNLITSFTVTIDYGKLISTLITSDTNSVYFMSLGICPYKRSSFFIFLTFIVNLYLSFVVAASYFFNKISGMQNKIYK